MDRTLGARFLPNETQPEDQGKKISGQATLKQRYSAPQQSNSKQLIFNPDEFAKTSEGFKNGREFVPKNRYIPYRIKNRRSNPQASGQSKEKNSLTMSEFFPSSNNPNSLKQA